MQNVDIEVKVENKSAFVDFNFSKVCELLHDLEDGRYKINSDYVEARSTATIAFLILNEALVEEKGE